MTGDWRRHSEDLTLRLAHLVRLGDGPGVDDLDAALQARRAVAALATDVLFDISGLHRHTPRRWDSAELYAHPVEHLARVLQTHEQPLPLRSLAECLSDEAGGPAARMWRRAAADAALAHHEWNRLDPLDRRLGSEAWTAVHEVAQFCHALTWLDSGIAGCCESAGRRADATALVDGLPRLRGAARSVSTLAGSGPLPALRPRSAPAGRAALVIRRPEHLPAGLERLTHLLRTADHVSPQHVQVAYRLLGRLSNDAGVVLSDTSHVTLPIPAVTEGAMTAAALDVAAVDFSRALARAGGVPGRANSLERSDEVVVAQLQLIGTLTAAEPSARGLVWAQGAPGRVRRAAVELLRAATGAADALSELTVRCVEDRRWLVPAGTDGAAALTWVPSWPHQANAFNPDAPPLLQHGVHARRLGAAVRDALSSLSSDPPTASTRQSRPAVHRRLAAALASAERQALPEWARPGEVRMRPQR